MRPSLLIIGLLIVAHASFAQLSRKEKKAARKGTSIDQPTTVDPANSERDYSSKKAKHSKAKKGSGPTHNSMKEYEERLDARAKTYRKNEKNVSTPQYVDPMYFGHKKPPKKRPAHKMKLCKVCGIRH